MKQKDQLTYHSCDTKTLGHDTYRDLDTTKHMSRFKKIVATKTHVGINTYVTFHKEKKNLCNYNSCWDHPSSIPTC